MIDPRGDTRTGGQQHLRRLAGPVRSRMRLASTLAAAALLGGSAPARGEERPALTFTLEQVRAAVEEYVSSRSRDAGGAFPLTDDRSGKKLELESRGVTLVAAERLWRIHDPSQRVKSDGRGWFACVNFHPVGEPDAKRYDVDFRLQTRDGKLEVTDVVIHKEPRLVDGNWTWEPRFTLEKVDGAREH